MPRGWITHNSKTPLGVAYPLRLCFMQRVGLLTLLFLARLTPAKAVQPASAAAQPQFSAFQCKTLNNLIMPCYSLPCLPSSTLANLLILSFA